MSFLTGKWNHFPPSENGGRINVINRVCFGPYETWIFGIENGKYFEEYREHEGFGECDFRYISCEEFLSALETEIQYCLENNAPEQAKELCKYRNKQV